MAKSIQTSKMPEEGREPRACDCGCGKEFVPRTCQQRFATEGCRYRFHNARQRADLDKATELARQAKEQTRQLHELLAGRLRGGPPESTK